MSYESLRFERHGHIALLTLDRPDRLNALDATLRADTLAAMDEARADDDIRAVVITGAGRGFCSGADLSGPLPEPSAAQNDRLDDFGWVGRQATAIYGLDKPTVAAVNGIATGAGMSLALACDLRVGDPSTRFRTIFIERNLSPDSGMSFFLPRIVGYSRAADLLFTSREVDADEALRIGLIDRLVPAGETVVAALELAAAIAAWPPLAMRSTKRVLQRNFGAELADALREETTGLAFAGKARNDQREAFAAWREKRPAKFTGS